MPPSHDRDLAAYHYRLHSNDEQLDALARVLASGQLSAIGGAHTAELEKQTAALVGRGGALAVASATAGLDLLFGALGIGPGDEVVIPELGWVSVGGAASANQATVVVAPVTRRLTPGWPSLAPLLTPQTRAVVIAHLRGMAATDLPRIATELRHRGILLIEDCAQAWGVRDPETGRHVGHQGVAAVFSTEAHKLIATGEGGVVAADDHDLLRRLRLLAGDTRIRADQPTWRRNARMSEVHAAIALPQLRYLDELTARLRGLQRRMLTLLAASPAVEQVLPQPETEPTASNGSVVGLWFRTSGHAAAATSSLHAAGIPCWWAGAPGDLHHAANWPTRAARPAVDLGRYADVAVPLLAEHHHHHTYLDQLAGLAQDWTSAAPASLTGA